MESKATVYPAPQEQFQQPISSQPQGSHTVLVVQQQGQSTWSSGLFDCCEDPLGSLVGWCCYPCYTCYLSNKVGEACIVPCFVPGSMVTLRSMNRVQHNIPGSVMADCCTVCWCPCCAATQLSRHHDFMSMGMHPTIES